MMDRLSTIVAFTSLLASGCGLIERAACGEPCEGGIEPADGEPEDFTLAGLVDEDATITEPAICEADEDLEVFVFHIQTHGENTEVDSSEWVFDRLIPALRDGDGPMPGYGLGKCAGLERAPEEDGLRLYVTDWGQLDPLTMAVLDRVREDDVAVTVTIAVEPNIIACPDIGCGY
jgi:hypothetical protein